jgi:hypothetical protein
MGNGWVFIMTELCPIQSQFLVLFKVSNHTQFNKKWSPKEVQVFTVGEYSKTLQLLANQQVFKGVLRRVWVCTRIGVKGTTMILFYGALGDLTFDPKN